MSARHGWLLAALATAVSGCAAPPPGSARAALAGAHVLFLDFAGASIAAGASDDAVAGVSALGSAVVPAFDAAIVAPALAAPLVERVLVDRVRTLYARFDLDVVTSAPASGDYARVLVGGTRTVLSPPAPAGSAGIASLDCPDANPRSVGFAFSDEAAPQFGGPVALAATIAHEAGHGYGLEHVQTPTDPMYAVGTPQQTLDDLFHYAFGVGNYSPFVAGGAGQAERCGRADPLDDAAVLGAALGLRTAASAAPTVAIAFPPPVATVPTTLALRVSAADDVAVRRVEVYRDLSLIAALEAPPWTITVTLPPAQQTRLTVEAIDDEAQRASVALEVAVDPAAPAPCDELTACAGGLACVAQQCVAMTPVEDAGAPADGGAVAGGGGCAVARGRGPRAPWLALALLLITWAGIGRSRRTPDAIGDAPDKR
jgi:hypothetical protein